MRKRRGQATRTAELCSFDKDGCKKKEDLVTGNADVDMKDIYRKVPTRGKGDIG